MYELLSYELDVGSLPWDEQFTLPASVRQGKANFERLKPEHAVVCCDLVKPSMLGGDVIPLVDVLPTETMGLQGKNGSLYELPSLTFRPLAAPTFNSFSVYLLNLAGSPLYAHCPPNDTISFTFLFRRQQQQQNKGQ